MKLKTSNIKDNNENNKTAKGIRIVIKKDIKHQNYKTHCLITSKFTITLKQSEADIINLRGMNLIKCRYAYVIIKYNEFNIYTERLLSNLHSSNLVNTTFYLVANHKLRKIHLDFEVQQETLIYASRIHEFKNNLDQDRFVKIFSQLLCSPQSCSLMLVALLATRS